MMLNTQNWKEFALKELFTITGSKTTPLDELEGYGKGIFPYVTTQAVNNGVAGFYNFKTEKGNCLTVDSAVLGYCSYRDCDFSASDHVEILRPKFPLNKEIAMFLVTIINKEQYRYNYGRKASQTKLKNTKVKLPSLHSGKPDWAFMENYIKSLNVKPVTTSIEINKSLKLNTQNWKKFRIDEYFDIRKGKRLTKNDQIEGNIPYIGAIDSNNGVSAHIGQDAIHNGNTISLSYNGSIGEAFYQPEPFWATDDVNVLYLKEPHKMNSMIGLFICTILKKEKYRFTYGRKWTLENMNESEIKLPVTNDGKPDWAFMENYIKSLPYGDCI